MVAYCEKVGGEIPKYEIKVEVEDANLDANTITINGSKYNNETIVEEGNYTLKAKDLAGNELVVNFEIDKTPIIISGAENNGLYNTDVELEVTARDEEAVIKLDGSTIGSKYTIIANGKYKVKVTDKWGNKAELEFTIDKTEPTIINPFAELTNEVGAKKDAVQSVTANVTDNLDANKTIKPTVTFPIPLTAKSPPTKANNAYCTFPKAPFTGPILFAYLFAL
jgi:hypothetical protein